MENKKIIDIGLFNEIIEDSKLKLICVEGLDGAGKGVQVKLISEYYEKLGKKVKMIHFPMYGHNIFSDLISKFLRGEFGNIDEVDPKFVANIYAMDRYMYKNQLIKDLEDNDIVVMDRYVHSNIAFQCAKMDDLNAIKSAQQISSFEFNFLELPYPDLIIYLDVPIDTIEKRLNSNRIGTDRNYLNGGKDIHESDIEFQKRVRNEYLHLNGYRNYHIVECGDGDKILSPIELFDRYKNLLK